MAALLRRDSVTERDESQPVTAPQVGGKRDERDSPPLGASQLSHPLRRPPDLSAFAEPEPTPSRPAWSIVPDQMGPEGMETTILGAVVAYGVHYREAYRAFVWGCPPKMPHVGRPDVWGVMRASHSDLRVIFGPSVAEPEPLAANKASLRDRIARLKQTELDRG